MANLAGAERTGVVGNPLDDGLQGSRVGQVNPLISAPLDDGLLGSIDGSLTVAGGGGGPGIVTYFRMRCQDDGIAPPYYVFWTVTGAPDDDASEATLAGNLMAGSVATMGTWQV